MKKMVTIYTEGMPDREVEAECYFELRIFMVVSGAQIKRILRADTITELAPKTETVEGVSFIRYKTDDGGYVEFLKNAIVFRELEYIEEVPEEPLSQRERDREELDEAREAEAA